MYPKGYSGQLRVSIQYNVLSNNHTSKFIVVELLYYQICSLVLFIAFMRLLKEAHPTHENKGSIEVLLVLHRADRLWESSGLFQVVSRP